MEIRIGHLEHEFISLDVINRCHPQATDFEDGNWLNVDVALAAGGFRASFRSQLRAEEFVAFQNQLAKLYQSLSGQAIFATLDGWLSLAITGDGRGHLAIKGEAIDEPGIGNTLDRKSVV